MYGLYLLLSLVNIVKLNGLHVGEQGSYLVWVFTGVILNLGNHLTTNLKLGRLVGVGVIHTYYTVKVSQLLTVKCKVHLCIPSRVYIACGERNAGASATSVNALDLCRLGGGVA